MKNIKAPIWLKKLHRSEKGKINSRLAEFAGVFKQGKEKEVFSELVFCLLTPQSKAKNCWTSVKNLISKNLLLRGGPAKLAKSLKGVRFHNNKAKYIVEARKIFKKGKKVDFISKIKSFTNVHDAREWLVKNVKGLGYKEASHFLRNIGLGRGIAILDRHILKNLKILGIIKRIPAALNRRTYFDIENKMIKFSKKIGIPEDQLDLIFWRKQTGEYFK